MPHTSQERRCRVSSADLLASEAIITLKKKKKEVENTYCLPHPIDIQDKRVVPNNLLCLGENSRGLFDSHPAQQDMESLAGWAWPGQESSPPPNPRGRLLSLQEEQGTSAFSFTVLCRRVLNPKKSLNNGDIEIGFAHVIPTRRLYC